MERLRSQDEFARLLAVPEEELDMAAASFQIACIAYPELAVDDYIQQLDKMGDEVAARLPENADPYRRIEAINHYLYGDLGFAGNDEDYYDPRNSFLNDVIDRGTGIPITLSLVYMEVARRVGLPLVGISMPGHFLVRYAEEDRDIYIDPFDRGVILTRVECADRLKQLFGRESELTDDHLRPVSPRQILVRMLNNLRSIYIQKEDWARALSVVEWTQVVRPEDALLCREIGALCFHLGERKRAGEAWGEYLLRVPDAPDSEAIRAALASLQEAPHRVN
jgi:regulator of sirC expression with transglutaminase-like and TPR domain